MREILQLSRLIPGKELTRRDILGQNSLRSSGSVLGPLLEAKGEGSKHRRHVCATQVGEQDMVEQSQQHGKSSAVPRQDGTLYKPSNRISLGPTGWDVVIFWDPPQPASAKENPEKLDQPPVAGAAASEDGTSTETTAESGPTSYDASRRKNLLIVKGRANLQPVTILIDGGAAEDLIDIRCAKKLKTRVQTTQPMEICMARGQIQQITKRGCMILGIKDYTEYRSLLQSRP